MKVSLTTEQQEKVIRHISTTHSEYREIMRPYLSEKAEEYDEYTTFKLKGKNAWDTTVKVNKAYEAVEKRAAKLTSKEPKWITSVRPDIEYSLHQDNSEGVVDDIKKTSQITETLLSDIRKRGDIGEAVDRMSKDFASLGVVVGKASYKYVPVFDEKETTEVETDEYGEEIATKKRENVGRVKKIPTIDNVEVGRVFYDINYKDFDDIPCVIEIVEGVRASHILNDKRYVNTEELSAIIKASNSGSREDLQTSILAITGVRVENPTTIDMNSMILKEYYGYFNLTDDPKKEKLYQFCVVNDMIVIYAREIKAIPYVMVRCFADTLSLRGFGIVRPVIGLQKDFNFKRAARSQAIKQSINRKYIMSSNSGISPRELSKPDGIIFTDKTMDVVQNNFMELGHREINSSIFNDAMDDQREMQTMMFSLDTTQPTPAGSSLDTATGSKIEFYENNVVINKARVNFEKFISKMGVKVLYAMVENMEELDNQYIKIDNELIAIHKKKIEEVLNNMSINIEVGSTNFEKEGKRRDEAMAMLNVLKEFKMMPGVGENLNLVKPLKNRIETFYTKDINDFFSPNMAMLGMGEQVGDNNAGQKGSGGILKNMDSGTGSNAMDFSNEIAGTSVNLPL